MVKNICKLSDRIIMKNTRMPSLMALIALSILLLLPGYKKHGDHFYFPAPVDRPAIAFYANFAASGLYDQSQTAAEAFNEITSHVEAICAARNSSGEETSPSKAAIEALLNDRILSGEIKTHELFFYLRDSENFAFILRGEFSDNRIADLIGRNRVNKTVSGLNSVLKSPVGGMNRLYLELKDDLLVICPENIAGNILDNLDGQKNLLGNEFSAFDKMVRNRPAMAAELSFDALKKVTETRLLPPWLEPVKHLRVIAASRISKLQIFVPDGAERESLLKTISEKKDLISQSAGAESGLNFEGKGNSIFIEAPGGIDLEKTISRRTAAFFLHFFARSRSSNPVMTVSRP